MLPIDSTAPMSTPIPRGCPFDVALDDEEVALLHGLNDRCSSLGELPYR